MLNRRILRIKVFKEVYAYCEDQSLSLKEAQSAFSKSCEGVRDLYLFMLSIIPALTAHASERIESVRSKFHPTEEELHPNMKFVSNAVAPLLSADPDFTKIISKKKLSWDQYDVLLRNLYDSIKTKDYYREYMSSETSSLKEDAALFSKIFEEEFVEREDLAEILEDLSIVWVDDLAYALGFCCKTMDDLAKGERWELPSLYKNVDDEKFAQTLLRTAFSSFQEFRQMVSSNAKGWDDDRLFNVDVTLIICGLAEACSFPQMAKGIIINEYVEISKYYSTPKSRAFVNGVLDELIKTNQTIQC